MSIDKAARDAPGQLTFNGEPDAGEAGSASALRGFVETPALDLSTPYATAVDIYWAAGWRRILPLPRGMKDPTPVIKDAHGRKVGSWTGGEAQDPSYADIMAWAESKPRGNVALRAPDDIVFLDVDAYGKKRGDLALQALIAELGPLPATWRSSSRGDGPSAGALGPGLYATGQYAFRVPAGSYFRGEAADGIDIIQATHRYTVAWPSTNPHNNGNVYRWYRDDGTLAEHGEVPRVASLPELPEAWLNYLLNSSARSTKAALGSSGDELKLSAGAEAYLAQLRRGPACGRAINTAQKFRREMAASSSLHNLARDATRALIMLGAEGHRLGSTGVDTHGKGSPIDLVYALMGNFVGLATAGGKGRTEHSAKAEWLRLVEGAVALAAGKIARPRGNDPECIEFPDEYPEWIGPVSPGGVGAVPDSVASRESGASSPSTAALDNTPVDHWGMWIPENDYVVDAHTARGQREPLQVTNPAIASEWARETIGRGALSGLFYRGEARSIVYTPAIGEDGYRVPRDAHADDGPAQVIPLNPRALAAMIQYAFACFKEREAKPKEVEDDKTKTFELADGRTVVRSAAMFPFEAAQTAMAAPHLLEHVRRLAGVVHSPTVREDGSLLSEPGYDSASQLLYLPEPGLVVPAVPERPTAGQVAEARELLHLMVSDFPFVTTHDRAAYFGLLLTPLLRVLTPGAYKGFAISAHQAGSGKTLLATLARIIHGGVFRAELPDDEPELRKAITSILDTTTGPIINFDNVTGLVKSGTLAGLLTSAVWDDRRLGTNELSRCENDRLWVLTGNNMSLGGDLRRRFIDINIDPGRPDPQLRSGFAIEDIEDWTRKNRGRLIASLLVLVRSWVAAGRPATRASSDGYGRWLAAVNGILANAGVVGLCDAPEARMRGEGAEDAEWGILLEAIESVFGSAEWTAKGVLAKVDTSGMDGMNNGPIGLDKLPERLAEKLGRSSGGVAVLTRSFGRWLMNHEGRWANSLTVRKTRETNLGSFWRIERYIPKADTQLSSI